MIRWFGGAKEKPSVRRQLCQRSLEIAVEQIGRGEGVEGNNQGHHVWTYTNPFMTPRHLWRLTKGPWCAAFVSWCREAAAYELGLRWPKRSHNAKRLAATMDQLDHPWPGCVFLLHRGVRGSRKGHVGFVNTVISPTTIKVVDGNIGPWPSLVQVRDYNHALDPNFLGFFG